MSSQSPVVNKLYTSEVTEQAYLVIAAISFYRQLDRGYRQTTG